MIGGPDRVLCCRARLDGYRSAMEAAGLPVDADLVVRTDLTQEDGHAAALDLLSRPERPTAIFASNDLQALGVYQAARALGLRIPADLSVVGFDDLPIAALVDPPLTTVHQPLTEMAVAATELALALGRGEKTPQIGLELATTLTVREEHRPARELTRPQTDAAAPGSSGSWPASMWSRTGRRRRVRLTRCRAWPARCGNRRPAGRPSAGRVPPRPWPTATASAARSSHPE